MLFNFQMTRWRQKAWRDKPDHMEGIRQRATAKAKAVKDEKRQRLMGYLKELPDRMTVDELMNQIGSEYCRQREVTKAAFFRLIRKHGLLSYDPKDGLWMNNCK